MASIINALSSGAGGLVTSGDTSGVLQLQNNSSASVTLDASGNVGIGTTSPLQKLDMNGTTARFSNGSYTGYLGAGSLLVSGAASDFTLRSDNVLSFGTGGPYERMRIDSSGNTFFAGRTSTGTTNTGCYISVTSGIFNTGRTATGDVLRFFCTDNGNQVGQITVQTASTTYSTSSDYRLKENIAPMIGALDKVAQLKPVTYTWKADGSDGQGFIAHELAEIIPDCVVGKKDAVDEEGNPVYQGIDTSFLVATLTAAIKEQQTLIVSQSELINNLTARIEALEAK